MSSINLSHKMRIMVVEDENDVRVWLCDRLRTFADVEVVGEAIGIESAFKLIAQLRPDALFLDVKLSGGDAFELLRRLRVHDLPIPHIVMMTGFPAYAVEVINENFSKYIKKFLVKPFVHDWEIKLQDAIDALMVAIAGSNLPKNKSVLAQDLEVTTDFDFIFLKKETNLIKIYFHEIAFIEAAGEGKVIVATEQGELTIDFTLAKFLENLPVCFRKISRFNAVNMNKVLRLMRDDQGVMVTLRGKEKFIGVGKYYYQTLLQALPQAKLK